MFANDVRRCPIYCVHFTPDKHSTAVGAAVHSLVCRLVLFVRQFTAKKYATLELVDVVPDTPRWCFQMDPEPGTYLLWQLESNKAMGIFEFLER
jgi:hypothetical protein